VYCCLAKTGSFVIIPDMLYRDRSGSIQENTEKSLHLAVALFPGETWVYKEPNVYVAESRLIEEKREKDK
jgi:hypothetical protein